MDSPTFEMFFAMVGHLKNQETLRQFKVACYPNLEKKDRDNLHKEVMKAAYPDLFREARAVTSEDLKLV